MTKFVLSLDANYVKSWTVADAIRELFQNALDQQLQHPENRASWEYDKDTSTLRICNKTSSLERSSLLLGGSTKSETTNTVGQYGEGYKIAALILLRNGLGMTIYNYASKEVWRPRMVKSRSFGASVLTFFIESMIWKQPPDNDLTVEVTGLTPEEYECRIIPTNLHLQPGSHSLHFTEYGEVLIQHKGEVFVNGLFVCKYDKYKYGYNFKPKQVNLDRDRKLISDFDLRWLASKMWSKIPDALKLVEEGVADVEYLIHHYSGTEMPEQAWDRFRSVHGPNAIPIVTQDDLVGVPKGYKGVIVSAGYSTLIKRSSRYQEVKVPIITPLERLRTWYIKYEIDIRNSCYDERVDELQQIIEDMENATS